jgi:hypothetical protein
VSSAARPADASTPATGEEITNAETEAEYRTRRLLRVRASQAGASYRSDPTGNLNEESAMFKPAGYMDDVQTTTRV